MQYTWGRIEVLCMTEALNAMPTEKGAHADTLDVQFSTDNL